MKTRTSLLVVLAALSLVFISCDTTTIPTQTTASTPVFSSTVQIVFTVNFNLNGGDGEAPEEQIVESGWKAEGPQNDPTRPGYVFTGWHATPEGGELFDFETTPILSNTLLYAGWTPILP